MSYPRLIFAFPHAFGLFDIYFVFSAGFSLPLLYSFPTQLVARILTFWYAEKYTFYTLWQKYTLQVRKCHHTHVNFHAKNKKKKR